MMRQSFLVVAEGGGSRAGSQNGHGVLQIPDVITANIDNCTKPSIIADTKATAGD